MLGAWLLVEVKVKYLTNNSKKIYSSENNSTLGCKNTVKFGSDKNFHFL